MEAILGGRQRAVVIQYQSLEQVPSRRLNDRIA